MNNKLKNGIAISIIPQIILTKWLGSYPDLIETYYSQGLYPIISKFFRFLFGWIPFSVGDLIYVALLFLAIRYLIIRRKHIRKMPKSFLRNVVMVLAVAYFTFHLLWGFNYYRLPLSKTLVLKDTHSYTELLEFTEKLIETTNNFQFQLTSDDAKQVRIPYSQEEIFKKTLQGYEDLEQKLPSLRYRRPSVKTAIFSTLLTYMGYGGYLNPFTHEAQVNGKLPNFRFPVVAGHEIGHQIGYSAENETNFVGYLVTLNNKDLYFKYSASAYALGYCLAEIKRRDEDKFIELYATVNKGIQKNYEEMNNFWMAYENPIEPIFKSVFNSFLKANNQPEGIKSYSLVVSLLVTYHERYPL